MRKLWDKYGAVLIVIITIILMAWAARSYGADATVAPIAKIQFMNTTGTGPCSGCLLYSYEPGTTTAKATYTTADANVANTNPAVMDAYGRANVFLDGCYKLILKNSTGSIIWTQDDICEYITSTPAISQWQDSGVSPIYLSATSFSCIGDQTETFEAGLRIKSTNTSGTVYSWVASSSFSGGVTTVTVVNESTALDSGLSDVDIAVLTVLNNSLPIIPVSTKTTGYTITAADCGKTLNSNISSSATFTLPAASAVPSNCEIFTQNTTTYALTIGGTMNGSSNPVLFQYNKARLVSNNSSWYGDISTGSAAYNLVSIRTFTTGTTYAPTVGTRAIMIEMVGGGGSGQAGSTPTAGNASCGGGGGSGGYARKFFTGVNLASSYTYSVGSGGVGPAAGTSPGATGGDTTFTGPGSVTVTAFGGAGGLTSTLTTSTFTPAIGPGGAGGAVSTNGDVNIGGEGGDYCIATNNDGPYIIGGKGGAGMFGGAGTPDYRVAGSFTTGTPGTGYGFGGGGGITLGSSGVVAESGGSGVIYVWEFN